ncbi:MAG TPA: HEAT repeat domain-containing protein [Smithella sp.]|nr:HEAT repeat domain-containing protein [Smithella sp.]
MKTIAETGYKKDEKKDFTPEEFAKAKTTCDFVIELTKAISRSGYYDAHHPVSQEVKKGLYDAFKNALGGSSEIMLTCHDVEDQVDVHISGILDEPFNIRKLTQSNTSDLFVPKLKDYFERKSLNSFVIKKDITAEHFESFIDVMSEPIADSADTSKLGEYLTKSLVDLGIAEVSTIFKTDIVLSRGKLPWRVSIILRRLAKDLKVVPMFRHASEEKMKVIKKQIVEDIIRPLNNFDLLKDLIVNCDIIIDHITHFMEIDELGELIISSLPADTVIPVAAAVFEIYQSNMAEGSSGEDENAFQKRSIYLVNVLKIAARRIHSERIPNLKNLFEQLYEHQIIDYEMLPASMRSDRESSLLANEVISKLDAYLENSLNVTSQQDMEELGDTFKRVMPEWVRMKKWDVIARIIKAMSDLSLRHEGMISESTLLAEMPDSLFEGAEDVIVDAYVNADKDLRKEIGDVLLQLKSIGIKIVDVMIDKSKDPDVLKGIVEILSRKGEFARQWAIDVLDHRNQSLTILNTALLAIVHVGHGADIERVRKFTKHSNSSIRARALTTMVKMNQEDAGDAVMEALNDGEEKVRNQAASLIEHDLFLSGESVNKLLLFLREKLRKKDMTASETTFVCGLLKATSHFRDCSNQAWENEMIGIASDLLSEKKGLLKFIKTEPTKERMDMLCACSSALGKAGGTKSVEFLKTLADHSHPVISNAAKEAMAELKNKSVNK